MAEGKHKCPPMLATCGFGAHARASGGKRGGTSGLSRQRMGCRVKTAIWRPRDCTQAMDRATNEHGSFLGQRGWALGTTVYAVVLSAHLQLTSARPAMLVG